ncbi:MAG: hypothetical protein M3Q08_15950 [Pseudomonadota bacterium]|nr:hypothetical protein [Pseudomonadota bacterium]
MKMKLAFVASRAIRALGLSTLAAGIGLAVAAPAVAARTAIVPYLEVQQVLSADLNEGDVLTYTSLAAGVDARSSTRSAQGQVSYRYERRIAWDDDLADEDVHTGLAAVRAELIPNMLAMNAGALATRARVDGRGPIFGFSSADSRNLADVYSLYAGPDFSSTAGLLDVAASYRLGYVKVDNQSLAGFPLLPGASVYDRYDSSTNHTANVSVGMAPGVLPFGWTASAGYAREDVDRLDQRFEGKFVRGDVLLPLSPTFALTGGVGYEKIESSQSDVIRNEGGVPIVTPGGRLIADPSKPRLLAYDQSGLIWDAGVIWRPSRRTEVQGRVGRRYGDTAYTGSIKHKLNSAYAITGSVYDSVDSFGRIVVADLANVPTNFRVGRNPLNPGAGGIGGCVFGNDPGTGSCLDDAFQAISTANFRNRGANVLLSGGRGPWSVGIGAGYSQRKYFSPDVLNGFALDRFSDESVHISGSLSRQLSRTSGLGVEAYASWFDSGAVGADAVFGTGITGSYHQSFLLDRLQGHAAIGLYTTDSGTFDSTVAQALVGLRYSF